MRENKIVFQCDVSKEKTVASSSLANLMIQTLNCSHYTMAHYIIKIYFILFLNLF